MKEINVTLTTFEPMLGSQPADPAIADTFIASNAPDAKNREEEIAAIGVDAAQEKAMTVFPRNAEGIPILWDYQIKGMFKDTCGCLNRVKDGDCATKSSKLKAYKKVIDGLIFVKERQIPIIFDGEMTTCQRPLRAMTMQGERVSLAKSEEIPAGATLTFTIQLLDPKLEDVVLEWLDYGKFRGLGQWRNSGKGRYTYEINGIEGGFLD